MQRSRRLSSRLSIDDSGLAMMAVITMTAIMAVLVTAVGAVTVNNLRNSRADESSLVAFGSSEAGVAQAIQYLRGANLSSLTCLESNLAGATCTQTTNAWTSKASPQQVVVDGSGGSACTLGKNCFKVWIGTVTPYVPNCAARHASPPGLCSGVYRIHATGQFGSDPATRRVAVDVKVTPYSYPMGIYTETFSGNGNPGIHRESVFTAGCIVNRQDDSHSGSGFQFEWDSANSRPVLDLIWDQPSAAHAVGDISTSNNSCGSGSGGAPIHNSVACNSTFPWDQDASGGDLTSTACYGKYTRSDGSVYPTKSKFTSSDLAGYGYQSGGLTDAQYAQLRTTAAAQGLYNINPNSVSSTLTALAAAGISSPVLYWDANYSGNISLSLSDFPSAYKRATTTSTSCASSAVTIVVRGNDLKYAGGNTTPYLVAAIFVPDGTYTGQGGSNTIGTVFAKTIDLGGGPDFYMDQCFASNPPASMLDVRVQRWNEDDSTDVS